MVVNSVMTTTYGLGTVLARASADRAKCHSDTGLMPHGEGTMIAWTRARACHIGSDRWHGSCYARVRAGAGACAGPRVMGFERSLIPSQPLPTFGLS